MTNFKGTPIEAALNVLVEAALVHGENVDLGYYFETQFRHFEKPIGDFRITVQRIKKP